MNRLIDMLRTRAGDIASAAVDNVDADGCEEAALDLVNQIIECLDSDGTLDVEPLQEQAGDDALVARLLRAIDFECIEALQYISSTPDHARFASALRELVRPAIPREPLSPWCVQLVRAVEGELDGEITPAHAQLLSFSQGVSKTMRDMIYAHDLNGRMFYLNNAGLAMVKYSEQDLLDGISVHDVVVLEYVDLIEARLESPGAVLRAPFSIEIYAKDGERIPIEIDTRPLRDDTKEIAGVVGIARDLRLEHRLQEEIQRSNAHLERIISSAPIGILTIDEDAVVRDANPAAASLGGASNPRDLIGQPLLSLGELTNVEDMQALIDTTLKGGRETRKRIQAKTRFGATVECDLILTPLRDGGGKVTGALIILS